jgi:hypothetical protein
MHKQRTSCGFPALMVSNGVRDTAPAPCNPRPPTVGFSVRSCWLSVRGPGMRCLRSLRMPQHSVSALLFDPVQCPRLHRLTVEIPQCCPSAAAHHLIVRHPLVHHIDSCHWPPRTGSVMSRPVLDFVVVDSRLVRPAPAVAVALVLAACRSCFVDSVVWFVASGSPTSAVRWYSAALAVRPITMGTP